MPTAYVDENWKNPERTKIFGGSLADVYVYDGFTVAVIVEPGFSDKARVETGKDVAVYRPDDAHRTTPMTWVRDLAAAESYIQGMRARHPEWPTAPVPLKVRVPEFTKAPDPRPKVVEIAEVLEAGDYDFHGGSVWMTALGLYVHCQGSFIDQAAIDQAHLLHAVLNELKD